MELVSRRALRPLVLAAVLASAAPAFAAYVFTTVDYPGAVMTDVRAIDNTGKIAGYASLDGVTNFSFTYAGGVFAPLPFSPLSPSALGMNDSGVIVGGTSGTLGTPEQGFIFQAGAYTFFSRPGWTNTEARGINNAGVITGWSYETDPVTGGFTASSGFIYKPGSGFIDIPVPPSTFVIAQGINTAEQVVGSASLPGNQSFLRQPDGTMDFFQVAGLSTRARGINDTGLITGWVTSAGLQQAFVGDSSGYQLLSADPSSVFTAGEAINNAGQISGVWNDTAGNSHGFIGTPAAMPTGTTSGGAYTFGVDVIPDVPIFIDPPVAAGYDYAIGKGDPRIAKVQLPIGIGDSLYVVKVGGRKFAVAGGEWFDFRAHGFAAGVSDFRVGCIEASAGLDPANAQAFPTGLTFVAGGRFTGTQAPRTKSPNAHEGASCLKDD